MSSLIFGSCRCGDGGDEAVGLLRPPRVHQEELVRLQGRGRAVLPHLQEMQAGEASGRVGPFRLHVPGRLPRQSRAQVHALILIPVFVVRDGQIDGASCCVCCCTMLAALCMWCYSCRAAMNKIWTLFIYVQFRQPPIPLYGDHVPASRIVPGSSLRDVPASTSPKTLPQTTSRHLVLSQID